MTINGERASKRAYSAPTLVSYGDMAQLTKTGTGSLTETQQMNGMDRKP